MLKKCIAECLGTCVLVVFGCGTAAAIGCDVPGGYVATALAFGLVIVAMAYSIGNVSGCHVNPAVSLAMLISGRMSVNEFISYVISQCIGGVIGALILKIFATSGDIDAGLGANGLYNDNVFLSILIEIILTFVFIIAILGVTSRDGFSSVTGLVIGLTLTLVHLLGIHFTGTSVNPARSLGPALLAGGSALTCVWVFIVAPLIGAALAALCYKYLDN
ncbi:MAG: aquaporin [Butyrivibrio sp.]|uniref:MIP/aquaporin family protein n=1 Tax=Butyrivibrio sp. TaxID=28121 RepID=UPI0025DC7DCF|nr:aquaporin [Butyrivibrio sp.]MCR5770799.1 aquaporin [Butyrivibrio sp.]